MDERYLREALRLAGRGRFRVAPNPRVGAVVVRDGEVIGRGYHHEVGGPHAEVLALEEAGSGARGATLFLNLEPCSHQGRTPPCADAVIAAGVRRVVACHADPNPIVSGRGFSRRRDAGIAVEVGALAESAVAINLPFLVPAVLGRPAVTLKWAMSFDGRIATSGGESQWISSPQGRRWALELREENDAILVGSGTAIQDDPALDRRLGKARGRILRVVVDRRLRFPLNSKMLSVEGPVVIFTSSRDSVRIRRLEDRGAEVVVADDCSPTAVLAALACRGIDSLLVEGGGEMLAAFVEADQFDRVAICLAPRLIGGRTAPGPLAGHGIDRLDEAAVLGPLSTSRRGPDLIVSGLRKGRAEAIVERLEELA